MATKTFTTYRLHFTSPLHVGDSRSDYGISLQTVNSDTLYAAITSCLAKTGHPMPADGDLGCTLSSLFPFYQKDSATEPVLFFPRPLRSAQPILKDVTQAKKVKKVAWLDQTFFERAIAGEVLFDQNKDVECIRGQYATRQNIPSPFISSQVSQRVTVSRDMSDDAKPFSKPFYMDKVFFSDYSGLYFICEGNTELIDQCLPLLQWEGLGTDRNVGNGFFRYEKSVLNLAIPDGCVRSMALSLFIPESREQWEQMTAGPNIAYDFQRRGGWITSPPDNTLRKNAIYGITAGSVFCSDNKGCFVAGRIVDLRPSIPTVQHPIWRCGRSIFIPVK